MIKKTQLNRMVGRIEDLPTLPRTVLKITELVNNPQSSAKDLARVVTEDQVLTARLLKLVNSSFYGFPRRISTVTGAIVLVGFDAIRNLLLTSSIFDLFSQRKKKQGLRLENLWDHSLGCAVGAKIIGACLRYDKVEELFVCGLLHDIGKIIEIQFLPREFGEVTALVEHEHLLIKDAETQILGFTHGDIGELLARKWNLSPKLATAIACHHRPQDSGRFMLEAAVVHLADILCRAVEMGSGGDDRMPALDPVAWTHLGLKTEDIDPILMEMEKEFEDIRLSISQSV